MKTTESERLYRRAAAVMVEGVGSASRGPATFGDYPQYMRRAEGARLYDADGNEYIDWMLAFGALPMGHAHPKIVEVIRREVANGTHFATALEVEVEVAELLVKLLPHAETVRFANTGTEAAMACIRLARGLTGRRKIVKFEGHYHGWYDAVLVNTNPQLPAALGHRFDPVRIPDSSGLTVESWRDTVVVPWNDLEAFERAMAAHGRDAALVVTEGVMANMGVIPPKPGFLKRVEEITKAHGALFYLDETVTGFRVAAGGCAELYGLAPDIVSYGKALGQGFPVAAIAGSKAVMEGFEWGKVLHYGTHNSGRLALFAAKTMLEEMLKDDKAGFRRLTELGERMSARIRKLLAANNRHPAILQNVGSMFQIFFTERESIDSFRDFCAHVDRRKFRDFARALHGHGVFMSPSNTLHSLSCIAHTDQDIDRTADAIGAAVEALR
jgi:glutamate-1-semialdehyde 2,1-aminomutase